MLEQVAAHAKIDLTIECKGNLHIDEHHIIEDTGITLGKALAFAMNNKQAMENNRFLLAMDNCLTQIAGVFRIMARIEWEVSFKGEKMGVMFTEMFFYFLKHSAMQQVAI